MNFWLDFLPVKAGNNTIRCKYFKKLVKKESQIIGFLFYSISTLNFK